MKNTQNRSKPQIFQYLSEKYVNQPLKYLQWFYGKYKLAAWQELTRHFLSTGSVPQTQPLSEPQQVYQHIVNHIDLAYLIKERGGASGLAAHFLEGFFDFKPRKSWLELLDSRLTNQNVPANSRHPDKQGPDRLTANLIELLHYLNYYFYLIAIGRGNDFRMPMYVLPDERLVDELLSADRLVSDLLMNAGLEVTEHAETPTVFEPQKQVSLPEWMQLSPDPGAVRDFFGINSLDGWRENLWRWYQTVLTENLYWSGADPQFSGAQLLDMYACFCALLNIYRSLPGRDSAAIDHTESPRVANDPQDPSPFEVLHPRSVFREQEQLIAAHGQEVIRFHYVSPPEACNPLPVITALVEQYSQAEWDGLLYEWLSYGLSANALSDSSYGMYGTRVYQTLAKITELSYLLAFNDELKYRNPS